MKNFLNYFKTELKRDFKIMLSQWCSTNQNKDLEEVGTHQKFCIMQHLVWSLKTLDCNGCSAALSWPKMKIYKLYPIKISVLSAILKSFHQGQVNILTVVITGQFQCQYLELFSFTGLILRSFFLYWFFIIYSYLIYLIYLPFICQRPIYYGPYINMNYRFTPHYL